MSPYNHRTTNKHIILQHKMQKLLLSLLLVAMPFTLFAQKAFRPVKAAMKAKNYKEVLSQVTKLREDSVYRNNPKLCIYSIEAQRGLNDAENMKLYLKKSYDTIAFFSTTHQIIREAVKLDSIERAMQQTEQKKPKQTHWVSELLRSYFPNLNAAARYYYKQRKFNEAMTYLRTCLDLPHTSLGQEVGLSTKNDTVNAVLYLTSAYNLKQYKEVHRYEPLALQQVKNRISVVDCLVRTAEAENDTATYKKWLTYGWKTYPEQTLFFTRLIDYNVNRNNYRQVVDLATLQLSKDSTSVPALLAHCLAYLNLNDLDNCISAGLRLLQVDSANVNANYYIGAAFVSKALQVSLPDNPQKESYRRARAQQKEFYVKAEPYLERYRKLSPQSKNRWAPLLYKVYLALNKGTKFAEIEKLL